MQSKYQKQNCVCHDKDTFHFSFFYTPWSKSQNLDFYLLTNLLALLENRTLVNRDCLNSMAWKIGSRSWVPFQRRWVKLPLQVDHFQTIHYDFHLTSNNYKCRVKFFYVLSVCFLDIIPNKFPGNIATKMNGRLNGKTVRNMITSMSPSHRCD